MTRLTRIWSCIACSLLASCLLASNASAQGGSGINGKVADSTAGAMPGVTVTISSPALQVRTMTTVTTGDGTYRFIQLPPGTYEVRYELAGFKPAVRSGVILTQDFIASINITLEIGALEESITVSGASPVIDATNSKLVT